MSAAAPVAPRTATRRRRRGAKHWIGRDLASTSGVAVVAVVMFFPIYWMLVSSIQPLKYALHFPPPLYPKAFNFGTYRAAAAQPPGRHLDLELDAARTHDHGGHDRAGDARAPTRCRACAGAASCRSASCCC